jgi:hypothetical protein
MRSGRQRERPDARKDQEASLFLDSTGASSLHLSSKGTGREPLNVLAFGPEALPSCGRGSREHRKV